MVSAATSEARSPSRVSSKQDSAIERTWNGRRIDRREHALDVPV